MVGNKLEQAVVYDPSRNDLFCATKGRGAYMNDRRIRVAKRIALRDCLLSTGFPFRPGDAFQTYMQMLGDVMPKCAGVRRPGSAALDLAYVAAGFTDGFFEMGLSPWDVAAGALLVTEAGGLVGNFTGESNFLEQKECMAANPKIYGQLVGITSRYSKFASAGDKAALRQSLKKSGAEPVAEADAETPEASAPTATPAAGHASDAAPF
jgi:myo-inositol-1(or 4)-monophosphatase